MTGLNFSLGADATSKIQEAIVCLAKFGEYVSFEARDEKVRKIHILPVLTTDTIESSS